MAKTELGEGDDLATLTPEDINEIGRSRGKMLSDEKVKTSQIRNVYGVINGIRAEYHKAGGYVPSIERRLVLLKPKLAYAVGRNNAIRPFYTFMVRATDGVVKSRKHEDALKNFFDLIEAVVAYHKFYGEKE